MQPGETVSPYGFSAPLYAYYAAVKKLPLGSSLGLYPGGCPDSRILRRVTSSDRFWFVYSDLNSKIAPMAPKPGDVGSIQDVRAVLDRIGRYAVPQRRITGKHAGAVEFVLKPNPAEGPASQRCLGTLPPQPSV
jgi:hypothetical protein